MKNKRFRKVSIFILTFLILISVFAFTVSATTYLPSPPSYLGEYQVENFFYSGYINPLDNDFVPCYAITILATPNGYRYYFEFYNNLVNGSYNDFTNPIQPNSDDYYIIEYPGESALYTSYGTIELNGSNNDILYSDLAHAFCDSFNMLYINPNQSYNELQGYTDNLRQQISLKQNEIDILENTIDNIYNNEIPDLRNQSYMLGFSDGMDYNNGFIETVKTIFSSPMYMINQVLNFNFFGVNLYDIFTLFVTICVVAFVIKLAI